MIQAIERAGRRILSMLGVGRATAASVEGATQTVQVAFLGTANAGPEIRDGIPSMQLYGLASATLPGCDYGVAFLSGDRSKGVAVASNDQRYRPGTLQPGEVMLYDNQGRQIYLSASGVIINANGAQLTVNGASTVTVNATTAVILDTPVLKCTGDIQDNYQTNTRTMAQMRSIYDGHTHPVSGVQAGSSNVTTSAPNQTE